MPRLLGSLPLLIPDDVRRHLTREGCFSELKLLGLMKNNWWFLGSFHCVTRAFIRVQKAFQLGYLFFFCDLTSAGVLACACAVACAVQVHVLVQVQVACAGAHWSLDFSWLVMIQETLFLGSKQCHKFLLDSRKLFFLNIKSKCKKNL